MIPIAAALFAALPSSPFQDTRPATRPSVSPQSRPSAPSKKAGKPLRADWGSDAPGQQVVPVKFKPIRKVPYWTNEEALKHLSPDDLVIGIIRGDQAIAYPIKMLGGPQREIVNQEIKNEPYVVNW
jgi:hypothetical protein